MTYPYTNPDKQRNIGADKEAADKAQGLVDGRVRLLRRNLHGIGYTVSQFISSLDYASQKSDVVANPLLERFLWELRANTEDIHALTGQEHHPIDDPAPEPPPKAKSSKESKKKQQSKKGGKDKQDEI